MTQIRRVTRSIALPRSSRPDASSMPPDHATATARLATVTTLFPAHAPHDQPRTDNIFADLGEDDARAPAARARARVVRLLPIDGVPSITNIFAEECADLTAEAEALLESRLASRPRKMDLARAEITAAHDERAAAMRPFANHELPRIAAGLAAVVTVLSLLQLPNA